MTARFAHTVPDLLPPGRVMPTTPPARLTVVETVYHQPAAGPPTATESRFSRPLGSDEQPYSRRLTIPTRWVRLDPGWVGGGCAALALSNEGPVARRTTVPTPEEAAADAALVVTVGVAADPEGATVAPFARVRPGESLRLEPADPGRLMLVCSGEAPARVLLTLIPA